MEISVNSRPNSCSLVTIQVSVISTSLRGEIFPFWQLPTDLRANLSHSSLIISKGDANYRRLLGDRHWPFTTPFDKILHNSPAPLVALRTLKAEVAAGLKFEQIERLNNEERGWLVNGRYGVIQLAP